MSAATPLGGTARRADVPSVQLVCELHGEVEGRVHRIGRTRDGRQRFRTRCPLCHTLSTGGSGKGLAALEAALPS